MPTVNALVIYTLLLGKKNYISNASTRDDKKLIVSYNTDVNEAIPFTTEQEAQHYIKRIHNAHNREFKTEPAQVNARSLAPVKLPKEKFL